MLNQGNVKKKELKKCQNCGVKVKNSHLFCPYCGQNKKTYRDSFLSIVLEWFKITLSIDQKIFKTLWDILFYPWIIISAYLSGKRKSYIHPLRLFFFSNLLFFGSIYILIDQSEKEKKAAISIDVDDNRLYNWLDGLTADSLRVIVGLNSSQLTHHAYKKIKSKKDAFEPIGLTEEYVISKAIKIMAKERLLGPKGLAISYFKTISNYVLLVLFVFSLILYLFYGKTKPYFIDHLIIGLFYFSHVELWFVLGNVLEMITVETDLWFWIILFFTNIIILPLLFYKVYKKTAIITFTRFILFQFVFLSLAAVIGVLLIFIAVV